MMVGRAEGAWLVGGAWGGWEAPIPSLWVGGRWGGVRSEGCRVMGEE